MHVVAAYLVLEEPYETGVQLLVWNNLLLMKLRMPYLVQAAMIMMSEMMTMKMKRDELLGPMIIHV